jgi:hypothetical protein
VTRRKGRAIWCSERLVDEGITVQAFIDIDPLKVGHWIAGRPVLARSGSAKAL